MNPSDLTIPMIVKTRYPILTYIMLAAVGIAIAYVLYLMVRHELRLRRAKKHGHSPHTGHHGNH
jgi:hypothetical protein